MPPNLTGDIYLVLNVELLEDLVGDQWRTGGDNYVYIGPFRVDNEPPDFKDSTIKSSAGDNYQSRTPKLDFKVVDERYSEEKDLKMCYSYDDEAKCPTPDNATELASMTRYKTYNPFKELREISDEYNGSTHTIYVTVADAAGNYSTKEFEYRVANSYKLTFDPTDGGACDHSSIGQIENKAWGEKVVNEKGLNVNKFCTTKKKGHSIDGWYTGKNGTGTQVKETDLATSDLKVYAKWKVNKYKLIYNSNTGNGCNPGYKEVVYDTGYGEMCTPTKKGYTFDGWYTAASGGTKVTSTTKMDDHDTTVYAHWTINYYKLIYNANGGNACSPTNKSIKYNTAFGDLCTTTRAGYDLIGWYTQASGGDKVTKDTKIDDHDTTIYAHWAAKSYTLTFNSNGGSACSPSSKTVTYNTAYGTLCTPTRNGYTFAGWYTAASGGTQVNENTKMGVGNTTIYAHWNPNPVYVTFMGNGSDGGSTAKQTCYYNENCTLSRNGFTKTGHAWTGWFPTATGGTKLADTIKLTGNLTVYAHWELAKYRINYNGNTHNSGSTAYTECVYNTNCQLRANGFEKIGHDFDGWFNAASGGTKYGTYTQLKNDITVYAHWKPKPYTVTYNGNGNTGGSTPSTNCDYNTSCTLATNGFTKTGYSWTGWWTAASGGTKYGSTVRITGNLPVFAQWKVNSYTLTYNSNGGNACSPTNKTLNYNDSYGTLCTPTRNGYTFAGWYTAASGGSQVTSSTKMGAGNTTIYAHWNANPVTVTFKGNGNTGGSMVNQTCYYNQSCTLSSNSFTKTGHTWKGWFAAASGGTALTSPVKLTGNLTVYAQWTPNVHTITYDSNGGSGTMTASSCNYGATCTLKTNTFTRTGYTFDGWYTSSSGGTKYGATTTLTGNIRVYAHWKANPVILSYNGNGSTGGSTGPTTCYYNQSCTTATNGFTRNGYTWSGWYDKTSGGTKYTTITLTAAKTLYAQWGANPIKISFNANGGSGTMSDQTCYYNTSCTLKANTFTRTGYAWNAWYTAATGGSAISTFNATGNLTVYARWKANNYTLTYNNNGGSGCTNKSVTFDATYGTLCSPTRTGYTFAGWYTAASGGTQVTANTKMTTLGATIYAHWTANSYTLTYNNNSGSGCTSKSVAFGSEYGTLCTPSRSGYSFSGWYTAASGGTQVTASTKMTTTGATIYAHWALASYTLTYNSNGGNACSPATKSVAYGAAYGTLCTPKRTGYTFTGWYTAASGGTQVTASTTMGAGNTTIYAQWRINRVIITLKSPSDESLTATTVSGSTTNNWSKNSSYMIYRNGSLYQQILDRGTSVSMDLANYNYSQWLNITKANYTGVAGAEWKCVSGCTTNGSTYTHNATTVNTQNICNTDNGDCTVVFQVNWTPTYTITYNANGGTGTTASTTCARGVTCSLRANGYTRSGYTFAGWWTAASGGSRYGASTTLTGNITVYAHWAITSKSFSYTGGGQSYKATAAGTYKLEVWGAQGGAGLRNGSSKAGGKGGYSYGNVTLTENQTIYIVVGGQGGATTNSGCTGGAAGYNGGGKGGNDSNCKSSKNDAAGGGGGATHIGKSSHLLKNMPKADIYIVAGGGGGGAYSYTSGTGGGSSGTKASGDECLGAGTQTAGYAFGQGGAGSAFTGGTGGGGGGYYGGRAGGAVEAKKNCPGAGGSGYIGGVSGGSTSANNHAGAGSAKITFVS